MPPALHHSTRHSTQENAIQLVSRLDLRLRGSLPAAFSLHSLCPANWRRPPQAPCQQDRSGFTPVIFT